MEKQCTSNILMIRPVCFGFNEQTAESNAFMQEAAVGEKPQENALKHFDAFVSELRKVGVNVITIDDGLEPRTPDSIFPNNWVSFHADGRIILYPMEAKNRRLERRADILKKINSEFNTEAIVDISKSEDDGIYLEGTGSLVLDRTKKVAYACLSSRTSKKLLEDWQKLFPDYQIIAFNASDNDNISIYHTNVLMAIGEDFSVICADTIKDLKEREFVLKSLSDHGKDPLLISMEQMENFAGNMLQIENTDGERILVMSSKAFSSLNQNQLDFLSSKSRILHAELGLIETLGGGSARCMLAEIHLPKK